MKEKMSLVTGHWSLVIFESLDTNILDT